MMSKYASMVQRVGEMATCKPIFTHAAKTEILYHLSCYAKLLGALDIEQPPF
jgi:hypothetical protein